MNDNVLMLAYLGDSIYEVYIRSYLINKGIVKVKLLQKEAIKYVSAVAQCSYLKQMLESKFLTEDEEAIVMRARNHKSHGTKSTDIITYKHATALEALFGYLYVNNNINRIEEIISYIVGEKYVYIWEKCS